MFSIETQFDQSFVTVSDLLTHFFLALFIVLKPKFQANVVNSEVAVLNRRKSISTATIQK